MKTLSTDAQDNNGGGAVTTGGSYDIGLTFGGGTAGSTNSGNAGSVTVANAAGTILTKGANAFGILAQSIGGGGGVTLGGQITSNTNFFGAETMLGSADTTTGVAVLQAGTIETQGAGASAILAQSIGGGGGLAGDIGWTTQLVPFQQGGSHVGNGGPITIDVQPNSVTEAAGANAPAIFAQSIGGGGGRVATQQGAVNGSAGGIGTGGTISIDIFGGALVSATGQSSAGIYAESAGQGRVSAPIAIQLGSGAKVSGGSAIYSDGSDAPGIMVDSGSITSTAPNMVDNSGTITSAGGTSGMSILNRVGYLAVTNEPTGVIVGNIDLTAAGGNGTIDNMGTITAGQTIALGSGTLNNAGTLDLRNGQGGTTLAGNYAGTGNGQVVVGVNFANGSADKLVVTGNASLNAAAVRVDATSWQKSAPVTVLTVAGSLDNVASLSATPISGGYALGLATTVAGNTVQGPACLQSGHGGRWPVDHRQAGRQCARRDLGQRQRPRRRLLRALRDRQCRRVELRADQHRRRCGARRRRDQAGGERAVLRQPCQLPVVQARGDAVRGRKLQLAARDRRTDQPRRHRRRSRLSSGHDDLSAWRTVPNSRRDGSRGLRSASNRAG